MNEDQKIARCGFCGSFFRGFEYLTVEELNGIAKEQLDVVPLGYCPNAQAEAAAQDEPQYATRDMAIDAGDPSLEGQRI